jgi:hypothetical protein
MRPATSSGWRSLARRQALKLSEDRYDSDFERLRRAVDAVLERGRQEGETAAAPDRDTGPTPASRGQVPPPRGPGLAVPDTQINFGQLPLRSQPPQRRVRISDEGDGRAATIGVHARIDPEPLPELVDSPLQLAFTVDEPISEGQSVPGSKVKVKGQGSCGPTALTAPGRGGPATGNEETPVRRGTSLAGAGWSGSLLCACPR